MNALEFYRKFKLFLRLADESLYRLPQDDLRALFGSFSDLIPPYPPFSEFNLFHLSQRSPFSLKNHRFLKWMMFALEKYYGSFFKRQTIGIKTREALILSTESVKNSPPSEDGSKLFFSTSGRDFEGERWLYINGMFTNQFVAAIHAEYLAYLFGRKIGVVYNKTSGWVLDVLKCVRDRVFQGEPKAEAFTYRTLFESLSNPSIIKVVLIAHSYGNIILSGVLRRLEQEYPLLLKKLEIYTFANCTNYMKMSKDEEGQLFPYIEHYANTKDIVCKVGILAKTAKIQGEVVLQGHLFTREAFGHLLNAHYLYAIEKQGFTSLDPSVTPRLYSYLKKREGQH